MHNLAHFDERRVSELRWPGSPTEYEAKLERICTCLESAVLRSNDIQLLGLAECTESAARDVRDRVFPKYELRSLDFQVGTRSDFHVAIIYDPTLGAQVEPPIVAPYMPRGTRAMAVLDLCYKNHVVRVIGCHWTARFEHNDGRVSDLATHLNRELFQFLTNHPVDSSRHALVIGFRRAMGERFPSPESDRLLVHP